MPCLGTHEYYRDTERNYVRTAIKNDRLHKPLSVRTFLHSERDDHVLVIAPDTDRIIGSVLIPLRQTEIPQPLMCGANSLVDLHPTGTKGVHRNPKLHTSSQNRVFLVRRHS